jgi:hypothetical protein
MDARLIDADLARRVELLAQSPEIAAVADEQVSRIAVGEGRGADRRTRAAGGVLGVSKGGSQCEQKEKEERK